MSKKRVAVITGGTMGIGLATAEQFVGKGDSVVVAGRNEKTGNEVAKHLKKLGGEVLYVKTDVANYDDCKNLIKKTVEVYGRVDILVNNAGIIGHGSKFLEIPIEEAIRTFNVNVIGSYQMLLEAGKVMKEQGKGVVINVGSIAGLVVGDEPVAYCTSKGAIRTLTQSAARQLAPYGIRVVSVAPGWVNTPLTKITIKNNPDILKPGCELHLKNRLIEPEEIADIIYLLSLDESKAINGTTVMVDDGFTAFKVPQGVERIVE